MNITATPATRIVDQRNSRASQSLLAGCAIFAMAAVASFVQGGQFFDITAVYANYPSLDQRFAEVHSGRSIGAFEFLWNSGLGLVNSPFLVQMLAAAAVATGVAGAVMAVSTRRSI